MTTKGVGGGGVGTLCPLVTLSPTMGICELLQVEGGG